MRVALLPNSWFIPSLGWHLGGTSPRWHFVHKPTLLASASTPFPLVNTGCTFSEGPTGGLRHSSRGGTSLDFQQLLLAYARITRAGGRKFWTKCHSCHPLGPNDF